MKRTLFFMTLIGSLSGFGQLKKMYEREAAYGHFSGVVRVVQADSIWLDASYGKLNDTELIDESTRFDVGSISKQFTAAAILTLVQEDKLSLSDQINMHLGSYASERWKKVNVHQLLTHTSGIPSVFQTEQGLEIFFPKKEGIPMAELIGKFSNGKLLFSPGEEFSYSNSGYILLAAIIEQVTGMKYEHYMAGLFERYGLNNTSFDRDSKSALPYYGYRQDLVKPAPIHHRSWFTGAGGLYSNLEDLSLWIQVIQSDDFLNDELRRLFLKAHTNAGYGYGWQFQGTRIQHDGGNDGFISFLSFDPEEEAFVIVLTNRSFQDIKNFGKSSSYIRELVDKSWKAMAGEEIEVLPAIKMSGLLEGTYEYSGKSVEISKGDSTLFITSEGSFPSRTIYNTPLSGQNADEQKMIEIARFLEKGKYWSLASHCDGEMKFVMYSGLMSVGMRMMKKQVGKVEKIVPYFVSKEEGVLRMSGDEGILDLILYFDSEGLIQGIFEHGNYEPDRQQQMIAYPLGQNLYYLDGLPYGEKSATLKIVPDSLTVYQLNRSVVAKRK